MYRTLQNLQILRVAFDMTVVNNKSKDMLHICENSRNLFSQMFPVETMQHRARFLGALKLLTFLSRDITKLTKWRVCQAKTQISLDLRPS